MIARFTPAFVIVVALLFAAPAARADQHLDASVSFIKTLSERAISTLTDTDISGQERRTQFRNLFREGFAVDGIARFALGRYWRSASKQEREEYLVLFEDVIVNTWADRFSLYSGQAFEVRNASNEPTNGPEKVALVSSLFFTSPTSPVRIEWRVASQGEIIKIVDVKLEGISMANTQRDEFNSVIRNGGRNLSALLARLRKMRDS
ncbi:MAG: ABC transporter substrate-binding protein [Rhodospirillaceae bacterium]|nr:ABC transporter substrate-binding protein [Rhodospirillaceae bacterium]MBT3809459.1 ABC transporter substrate-binding protein [Rhodospirillaceae bacterium]MBT3929186.1 ABC transporter substrate-binding protein [Rhodospirillaceae bacterium]MBT4774031.1 ABC transporter substrate-binding protein [Rhodospirillaceae bacterium]MBT5358594.1 ABC transporter substrate-binding protein [Rhodospirillaceae bacterium]